MDLFEHQGKELLAGYGLPVPPGQVAFSVEEAVEAARRLGPPVVVKAQVHTGGRGKAGGVRLAADLDEARTCAQAILGLDISGHTVKRLLIEKASEIAAEYYASFTLDRSARRHLGMLSAQGGVEIEAVAEADPDAIARIWIDPVEGLTESACRAWVAEAGLTADAAPADAANAPTPNAAADAANAPTPTPNAAADAANANPPGDTAPTAADTADAVEVLTRIYGAYADADADLIEVNPLIRTAAGDIVVLDAKVTLDANSVYRHPGYAAYDDTQPRDERERAARAKGLQYVGLDGSVGVIANGAGLAMSTVDVVTQAGGRPANFLDIGGGANASVMAAALEVINNDPAVRSILVNIFGGITRGEEVANGILEALERVTIEAPIVIRLDGTNAAEGRAILEPRLDDRLLMEPTMLDAARRAVELAGQA